MSVDILSVTRSHRRPHTFKGVAYKRGGNTTIALTREQYNELLFEAFHATQRWENEPAPDSTVGDLDRMEIARTIEAAIQSGASRIPGHGTLWTWLEDLGYYPTAA